MEILTNSATRKAYLEVPVTPLTGTMTVQVSRGAVTQEITTVVAEEPGKFSITIPYLFVQTDGYLTVQWDFQYEENAQVYDFTTKTFVTVSTPYLTLSEIEPILGPLGFTDAELLYAEQAARRVIDAHTGQKFAVSDETIKVASESNNFMLPKRLISVTSSNPEVTDFEIQRDGWVYALITPTLVEYYDRSFASSNGVIYAPYDVKRDAAYLGQTSRANRVIEITGRWGWEQVPQAVREAAILLTEDFLSPENAYRDKYLESLTSPDWRIQYHGSAFRGTGNVRVDKLLEDYVTKYRWVVV